MIDAKFDMRIKNINNMLFNGQIFKICDYVNFFSKSYSQTLSKVKDFFTWFKI